MIGASVGVGADQTPICIGDLVQTRLNTNTIATSDRTRVLNRDVWRIIGINANGVIVSGFDRPNIRYAMPGGATSGVAGLVRTLSGAGIVYAQTRDRTAFNQTHAPQHLAQR